MQPLDTSVIILASLDIRSRVIHPYWRGTMKKIFQVIVFILVTVFAILAYGNLRARWEVQERLAAIDRAIEEKIARANADTARRNEIAARLQQEALRSEQEAQARWDAAKSRGSLPPENTQPGFTPATGNAFKQNGTRY